MAGQDPRDVKAPERAHGKMQVNHSGRDRRDGPSVADRDPKEISISQEAADGDAGEPSGMRPRRCAECGRPVPPEEVSCPKMGQTEM